MKKITTVLFDLDGTLIRMDQDKFIELYFTSVLEKLEPLGYGAKPMKDALENAVRATVRNNGDCSNEERFWNAFSELSPDIQSELRDLLDDYYSSDFIKVIEATCEKYPRAREIIDAAKSRGFRIVLATNPLFPITATYKRMELGGLFPEDFEYVTAYENSSFCKPNPDYFRELLAKLGVSPEECVMIGNDTRDDFSAHQLGIPVFILTECLINRDGIDLSDYPHGGFDDLVSYIKNA